MDKVPTIISSKDLDYISDMFNWNFIASKKANHYSQEVVNDEIKNILEELYTMHNEFCGQLINMLTIGGQNE